VPVIIIVVIAIIKCSATDDKGDDAVAVIDGVADAESGDFDFLTLADLSAAGSADEDEAATSSTASSAVFTLDFFTVSTTADSSTAAAATSVTASSFCFFF
jgi:hypothetical protein